MSKKNLKPKYDYQRKEQRRNNNVGFDKKAQKERDQMEKTVRENKISFGTLTFFRPKPTAKIGEFTLAFSKPLAKSEVYSLIKKTCLLTIKAYL